MSRGKKYTTKIEASLADESARVSVLSARVAQLEKALRRTINDVNFVLANGDDLGRRNTLAIIRNDCLADLENKPI